MLVISLNFDSNRGLAFFESSHLATLSDRSHLFIFDRPLIYHFGIRDFLSIFVNHSSLDDIPLTDNKCNVFFVEFDLVNLRASSDEGIDTKTRTT